MIKDGEIAERIRDERLDDEGLKDEGNAKG